MRHSILLVWDPDDGEELAKALVELTGRKTVPQVFIGAEGLGGFDGKPTGVVHTRSLLWHSQSAAGDTICTQWLRKLAGSVAL